MPIRVPTYDQPQVAPRALPGVRESSVASPALFGVVGQQQTDLAKNLGAAGSILAAASQKMQDREDADMVFRAETAAKDDYLKYAETVRERRGQNAWGATKDTEKWFADQEKVHSEKLGNDNQRRLFGHTFTRLRLSALDFASRHEAEERRKSLEESAQASVVGSINLAAAEASNGKIDNVPTIKDDISKRVQVLSGLNGWDPERARVEESKLLTSMHKQVLQQLAISNPTGAKEYYKTYKDEIDGSERDGIEKIVKEGTLREVTQTAVDDIMLKGLPLRESLALARDKFSGEEEDEIARRVKERFSETEAAINLGQKKAADEAWKVISSGGGRAQVPPAIWKAMDGRDQTMILDHIDAKIRRAKQDEKEEKDDIAHLDAVETLIAQGDITEKAQLDRYAPFFTKNTLRTLGLKLDKRAVVAPTELRRVYEERKGAKINPNEMNENEREDWMAFQQYLLENVKETKRPEDLDVWADRWFMRGAGTKDRTWVNDPNTFGEAKTKGRDDFLIFTPENRLNEADRVLTLLQKNGVDVPKNRVVARDEIYTKQMLEADRWAAAHGLITSPEITTAYVLLRQNRKPVTPANIDFILKQMKK